MPEVSDRGHEKHQRPITAAEEAEIRKLILEGNGDIYEVAKRFPGLVPNQVSWVKAHMTMEGAAYPRTTYISDGIGSWGENQSSPDGIEKQTAQGYGLDAREKTAVEVHAMRMAVAYFEQRGWKAIDVSSYRPYNLMCLRRGRGDLHVEVKGTTSNASQVFLTRNEVEFARQHYPDVALFIVSGIKVTRLASADTIADGGRQVILYPWDVDDQGKLETVQYRYSVHPTAR